MKTTKIKSCEHLEIILDEILANDNEILDITTGWTKLNLVIDVKYPLSANLLERISKVTHPLRFRYEAGSPHNRAEYVIICDACKVVLSFPLMPSKYCKEQAHFITEISDSSVVPERPYLHLRPIVMFLLDHGNSFSPPVAGFEQNEDGFYIDKDGWNCDLKAPIDFNQLRANFVLPESIKFHEENQSIFCEKSWVGIKGGIE